LGISVLVSQPTLSVLAAGCFLLASCATVTESERDEKAYGRENKEIEIKDDYDERAKKCQADGGSMSANRHYPSGLSREIGGDLDYGTARCVFR
jgi:hypothetical protein